MSRLFKKIYCIDCGKLLSKYAFSNKSKRCIFCAKTGKLNPNYGKKLSIATKKLISIANSGKNNPMYDKHFYGEDNPNYKGGKPLCRCGKVLLWRFNQCKDCYLNNISGENNPNWKNGISKIANRIRSLKLYKDWQHACFERDNYICQNCRTNKNLEVHHIISLKEIIKDYKINSSIQAMDVAVLWMLENGITYCTDCHCIFDKARYSFILAGDYYAQDR
jgi:5-methylcytosine-specific restriction endonuclease McrA